jgi:hypothetical protein
MQLNIKRYCPANDMFHHSNQSRSVCTLQAVSQIYNAATAAKIAPAAAMRDPVRAEAPLAGMIELLGLGELLPEEPEGEVPLVWMVVGILPPEETGVSVEDDDPEDPESVVEDGASLDLVEVPALTEEVGLLPEDEEAEPEAEAEEDEDLETSLQDKSNNGVVLKVEPTSPKLGDGTFGSAS